MKAFRPRTGAIRGAWLALIGDDPTLGKVTGPEQHRVLCPFHSERRPSCDVSLAKNTFKCRSCDASGGLLDLVVLLGLAGSHAQAAQYLESHGVTC